FAPILIYVRRSQSRTAGCRSGWLSRHRQNDERGVVEQGEGIDGFHRLLAGGQLKHRLEKPMVCLVWVGIRAAGPGDGSIRVGDSTDAFDGGILPPVPCMNTVNDKESVRLS